MANFIDQMVEGYINKLKANEKPVIIAVEAEIAKLEAEIAVFASKITPAQEQLALAMLFPAMSATELAAMNNAIAISFSIEKTIAAEATKLAALKS